MSAVIIPVSGVSFEEWATQTLMSLERYGILPRPGSVLDWRRWAEEVFLQPFMNQQGCPDPRGFADWRDWAERLNLLLGRGPA